MLKSPLRTHQRYGVKITICTNIKRNADPRPPPTVKLFKQIHILPRTSEGRNWRS
jgi:hypothetical protein